VEISLLLCPCPCQLVTDSQLTTNSWLTPNLCANCTENGMFRLSAVMSQYNTAWSSELIQHITPIPVSIHSLVKSSKANNSPCTCSTPLPYLYTVKWHLLNGMRTTFWYQKIKKIMDSYDMKIVHIQKKLSQQWNSCHIISYTNKLALKTQKLPATQSSRNSLLFLEPEGSFSSMLKKQKVNSFTSRKEYFSF
jgi:hypothetical protein